MQPGANVISLSGGKDSTAMLLMMLERGEPIADIMFFDTGWEFPQMYEHLIKIAKTPRKITLTETVLETLSIVAYKQPVTRVEIERIRGVSCDHAINKLMEYDLICELGRLDAPGRPLLFGTTEQFLRCFGVSSIEELPQINPMQMEEFKQQAEAEVGLQV